MSNFLLAVKSTLDRFLYDMAATIATPPPPVFDLDDPTQLEAIMATEEPAIAWEFLRLESEDRFGSMNTVVFSVGAVGMSDPSSYNILALAGKLKTAIETSPRLDIRDYSGADPGPVCGYLLMQDARVDPQLMDRTSSFRMASVAGKAVSYG
jgi:hypothetical protein